MGSKCWPTASWNGTGSSGTSQRVTDSGSSSHHDRRRQTLSEEAARSSLDGREAVMHERNLQGSERDRGRDGQARWSTRSSASDRHAAEVHSRSARNHRVQHVRVLRGQVGRLSRVFDEVVEAADHHDRRLHGLAPVEDELPRAVPSGELSLVLPADRPLAVARPSTEGR